MDGESRFADATLRLQTVQSKFRWRTAAIFVPVVVILAGLGFTTHGVYRAYYGGLSGLCAVALTVQYRRERALLGNRLLAAAVVTDWGKPLRSHSRFASSILSRFSGNIPLVKYSFVAFDQKTYVGETGWGARGLYKGAQIMILYNPGNPAANHPLRSFIFYSFH
ncbi:MAG TPA: hypothetical protein VNH65_07550 [Candidatus Acidoferrum sp.]|nr:hypothetical protein [Candidatus Acidoferrum sp.]